MFVEKLRNTCRPAASSLIVAALSILLSSASAKAASIVIDEAEMTAIFSQASFDGTPISIRFNPPQQIVDPRLLDINTLADLKALFSLAPDPAPTVDAFFVDQLNACGSVEPTISGLFAGCAQLPGHIFVEASDLAEIAPGPLMGHELGHNLNLHHEIPGSSTNLMAPFFPPGPDVTEDQVASMLLSPLVQTDPTGQRFITITPIAIVGTPEPSALLLLGAALGVLLIVKRNEIRTRRIK
ncbi:MAG: PEP-CTERM sorting domain-containing protein [Acidobacteriaceae bacterium]|nr:PEP-CTERM sorting domain-containing protein [Acidobacteriaceae bacterium]